MSAFNRFKKIAIAEQNARSIDSLLDQAFKVPIGSFLLIKGESGAGTTAVAIEIAKKLQKEKLVVFVDLFNSLLNFKEDIIVMKSIDLDPSEIISVLDELGEVDKDIVVMFDNIYLLDKLWKDSSWTFNELIRRIKNLNPNITIVGTQRRGPYGDLWTTVVEVTHSKNVYQQTTGGLNVLRGHLSTVKGPLGLATVYINSSSGQMSAAYEYAQKELALGKTSSSTFELDNIKEQGIWNFIHTYDRRKKLK